MIEELLAYKRMPLWTAETMPEAVKRKHNTKEGTWGKITVLKGRLKFVEMSEEGEELAEHIFEAGQDNPFGRLIKHPEIVFLSFFVLFHLLLEFYLHLGTPFSWLIHS